MEDSERRKWSAVEKQMLCRMLPKTGRLPYPLRKQKTAMMTDEFVYSIPKENKMTVLREVWPFREMPDKDTRMLDVHNNSIVRLSDMLVIRYNGRNIPVSCHYLETGGMAVDMVPPMEDD